MTPEMSVIWLLLALPLSLPAGWMIVTVIAWVWDILWNI
jgi:hypothetical protein